MNKIWFKKSKDASNIWVIVGESRIFWWNSHFTRLLLQAIHTCTETHRETTMERGLVRWYACDSRKYFQSIHSRLYLNKKHSIGVFNSCTYTERMCCHIHVSQSPAYTVSHIHARHDRCKHTHCNRIVRLMLLNNAHIFLFSIRTNIVQAIHNFDVIQRLIVLNS